MNPLRCTAQIIAQNEQGDILILSFAGVYPRGAQGCETAAAMLEWALQESAKYQHAALLFDFTPLNSIWGDGIVSQLLMVLWHKSRAQNHQYKTCFIATGCTAQALPSLLDSSGISRLMKTKIVNDVASGLAYLRNINFRT